LGIFNKPVLKVNTARTPLVDFLDFDDTKERLLLQYIPKPAYRENVHIEVVTDPFILVIHTAREKCLVVGIDVEFRQRK
jgi:hypothetical protein